MLNALRHPARLSAFLLPFVALFAGCKPETQVPPAPSEPEISAPAPAPEPEPIALSPYEPVEWSQLPAASDHDLVQGYQAWSSACQRLAKDPVWSPVCAQLPSPATPDTIRTFLHTQLTPYRLRTPEGNNKGLVTGYYEPVYRGAKAYSPEYPVPVYGPPADMITVSLESIYPELQGKRLRGRLEGNRLVPYDNAEQIRELGVNAKAIAWLNNPMDLQFLQIQGSGRIQLPNGEQLRVGYADQNGHPYRPIGRWLIEQGELDASAVNMNSIRSWAEANPARLNELLASNPSYVFFSTRPANNEGPRGSLNVPLTAGYSVAIDRKVIPLGSLLWLSTTRPDTQEAVIRPVAAQDTGGAIVGEVRVDLFWGTGPEAGDLAGHMKQDGEVWLLWPNGINLPDAEK